MLGVERRRDAATEEFAMKLQIVPLPRTADEAPFLVVISESRHPLDCPAAAGEIGARGVFVVDSPVEVLPMAEASDG
jgi:hypothetical protein